MNYSGIMNYNIHSVLPDIRLFTLYDIRLLTLTLRRVGVLSTAYEYQYNGGARWYRCEAALPHVE